ncbi:MAG: arginase family protein, partial [Desulfamplus sp.]|nr:arginase family protein [Desulfamplus sp.]
VISDNKVASDNTPLNAIPVLLGGEHTVTLGALRALKKYFIKSSANCDSKDSTTNLDSASYSSNQSAALGNIRAPFGIIQIDAHADLRDSYQGSGLSHACVMRRAVDDLNIPLFQIGVRAISYEEVIFRSQKNIPFIDAKDIYSYGVKAICDSDKLLPVDFPKKIYITLDVDGLDPSVIRATGTPVPGGISWYDTLTLLEKIIKIREVIGFDVVELAPVEGDHASDFAAAQLTYSVMGMIQKYNIK